MATKELFKANPVLRICDPLFFNKCLHFIWSRIFRPIFLVKLWEDAAFQPLVKLQDLVDAVAPRVGQGVEYHGRQPDECPLIL